MRKLIWDYGLGLGLQSPGYLYSLATLLFSDIPSQALKPGRGVNVSGLAGTWCRLCSRLICADSQISKAPLCAFESKFLET